MPPRARFARSPKSLAFCPTRRRPAADRCPIQATCQSGSTRRPPAAVARLPSAASRQNPRLYRRARRECASPLLCDSYTRPRRCCRSPPRLWPRSAASARSPKARRPLFPSAGRQAHPYPPRTSAVPRARFAPAASSIPFQNVRPISRGLPETAASSPAPLVCSRPTSQRAIHVYIEKVAHTRDRLNTALSKGRFASL